MRKWLRERVMRRRKKSPETEQTGRIGQERPAGGAAPLVPSYDFEAPPSRPEPPARTERPERTERNDRYERPDRDDRPQRSSRPERNERPQRERQSERPERNERPQSNERPHRMEIETQPESLGAPLSGQAIPAPPQKQPRAPRGAVVLTIGLPGSGKSTWYKRRGITPLSSDLLRTILFDNITEQRYQHLVFSTLRSLLRARLIAKMPWNYVDATNLSPHERKQWIKMSKGFGYEVQAVFFDVPVEVCMERNRRRERMVPEDVMRRMASKLKPPTFTEGFSKIVVVRVKGSAGTEPAEGAEAAE
jgi:predicted kinase